MYPPKRNLKYVSATIDQEKSLVGTSKKLLIDLEANLSPKIFAKKNFSTTNIGF